MRRSEKTGLQGGAQRPACAWNVMPNGTSWGAITQGNEVLDGRRCSCGKERTAGVRNKQGNLWRRQRTHEFRSASTLAVGRRLQGLMAQMADRAVRVGRGAFVVMQSFACRRGEEQ